jgi:hypothetical protein
MKEREELKIGDKWICKCHDSRKNQIATIVCVNVSDVSYLFEDNMQMSARLEFFFENFEKIENGNKVSQKQDAVNPAYYQQNGIQTWDYLEATLTKEEFRGSCKANVIKYVTRYKLKNGVEDLQKAKKYLEKLIEIESKK